MLIELSSNLMESQESVLPAFLPERTPQSDCLPLVPCWQLSWLDNPVAHKYITRCPADRRALDHKTFAEAILYREIWGGGVVILQFRDSRIMALDYSNDRDLFAEWNSTIASYAVNRLHLGTEGTVKLEDKLIAQLSA